jgi:hypothetical protein
LDGTCKGCLSISAILFHVLGLLYKCWNMWHVLQDELSPLVKQLLPLDCRDAPNVPWVSSITLGFGIYNFEM